MRQLFFEFYDSSANNKFANYDFISYQENFLAQNLLNQFLTIKDFNKNPFKTLILKGESCCGKTHLLNFLAHKFSHEIDLNFLNKDEIFSDNPLNFFRPNEFFVVDDLYFVENEEKLLHLINCANELQSMLIMVFREDKIFKLNDLNSRINNSQNAKIFSTNIENLKLIFTNILSRQQIFLTADIVDYILTKTKRSYSEIIYATKKIEFYFKENSSKLSLKNIKEIF